MDRANFWVQSGTVPGTSRNANMENQEPTEDHFQNETRPEVSTYIYRSPKSMNSDPKGAPYNISV